jgi:DNA modification methylase
MAQHYPPLEIEWLPVRKIKLDTRNAHRHPEAQIDQIAVSMESFGFNVPVLVNADNTLIAGEGRLRAAKKLGYTIIPAIRLEHLTPAQAKAFAIADNQLTKNAKWDDQLLGEIFLELSTEDLDFSLEATGFTMGEIDLKIEGLGNKDDDVADDLSKIAPAPRVTQPGDTWMLGHHRIHCGSALTPDAFQATMDGRPAAMMITDPPFNVPIDGHVSGKGKTRHREFAMGAGEMTAAEFSGFLEGFARLAAGHSEPGSLNYIFMDWRHVAQLQAAVEPVYGEPKNLCVWAKTNGGMGSLYRSAHELVLVFKLGNARHRNNVQLGRFGRNRTNVWTYSSPSHFGKGADKALIALHPTVKPVGLLADAMLDASARGDIVLDPFLGSGSTLLAAERVGRVCCGIEIDPLYVDLAIRRWQLMTGNEAIHAPTGESFDDRIEDSADVA